MKNVWMVLLFASALGPSQAKFFFGDHPFLNAGPNGPYRIVAEKQLEFDDGDYGVATLLEPKKNDSWIKAPIWQGGPIHYILCTPTVFVVRIRGCLVQVFLDFMYKERGQFDYGGYGRKIAKDKIDLDFSDLNADKRPELVFSIRKGRRVRTFVYRFEGRIDQFVSCLNHPIVGRVIITDILAKRPGKELVAISSVGRHSKLHHWHAWDEGKKRYIECKSFVAPW